jgi:hypothetical protein
MRFRMVRMTLFLRVHLVQVFTLLYTALLLYLMICGTCTPSTAMRNAHLDPVDFIGRALLRALLSGFVFMSWVVLGCPSTF